MDFNWISNIGYMDMGYMIIGYTWLHLGIQKNWSTTGLYLGPYIFLPKVDVLYRCVLDPLGKKWIGLNWISNIGYTRIHDYTKVWT